MIIEWVNLFRYIYWHAKFNAFVDTAYLLNGMCYIASRELNLQNIIEKMQIFAEKLPYVEFSQKKLSYMAEDLSNRNEWVDIFVATVHYQLGIEMQEAQELLYSVIAAIMSGDTLSQVRDCVARYSKR